MVFQCNPQPLLNGFGAAVSLTLPDKFITKAFIYTQIDFAKVDIVLLDFYSPCF